MSVLDDLRRAQEQLVARLQELEPLVAEYQELRQEADRLGLSAPSSSAPEVTEDAAAGAAIEEPPAPPKAPARPRRRTTSTSGGRSARRQPGGSRGGSRESAILQLVASTPGITVTAAGKELGVDPTGLYRPVRKLVAEGKIDKRGPALHPGR